MKVSTESKDEPSLVCNVMYSIRRDVVREGHQRQPRLGGFVTSCGDATKTHDPAIAICLVLNLCLKECVGQQHSLRAKTLMSLPLVCKR